MPNVFSIFDEIKGKKEEKKEEPDPIPGFSTTAAALDEAANQATGCLAKCVIFAFLLWWWI